MKKDTKIKDEQLFFDSLNIERENLKKYSLENFGDSGRMIIRKYNLDIKSVKHKYLELLDDVYLEIKEKMVLIGFKESKVELLKIRDELNTLKSNEQNIFNRLLDISKDYLYYNISKLQIEMHEINMMFSKYLYEKNLKFRRTDLPHLKLYQYTYSLSSSWFKDILWDNMLKNVEEIENSPLFYMFLYDDGLTNYGKENISSITTIFSDKIDDFYNENNISVLKYFLSKYKRHDLKYMINFHKFIFEGLRASENLLRENRGLPRIGEGWVGETSLYYEIKKEFPNLCVIHHGNPKFLGKQHYDIWIPELKIAIEYQGEQHDRPVDFFGGEESFQKQIERDLRKKDISEDNKIILIYVRKGYDINDLKNRIKSCRK